MHGSFGFGGLVGLCLAAACGSNPSAPLDAAMPDAAMPDAAMPDAPPALPAVYRWVIDKETFPATNTQAIELGLDLNGDQIIDNQFGSVFAALATQGIPLQADVDTAVSRGSILLLGEAVLGAGGVGVPTSATFTMYTGTNPRPAPCDSPTDVVCRHHLSGLGQFDVAATSAHDPPLIGTLSNGTILAGPGNLQVPILFWGTTPIVLDLVGARVRLGMASPGAVGPSIIAGAITQSEIELKLHPGIQQNASTAVAADCTTTVPPDCGCAPGSTGKTYLALFDNSPNDCVISLLEIRDSVLLRNLLAPDVSIEGQPALSFGFAVTAVRATFTP